MQNKKKRYSHPRNIFKAKVGLKASQDSRALELFFSVLYSFLALLYEASKMLIIKNVQQFDFGKTAIVSKEKKK